MEDLDAIPGAVVGQPDAVMPIISAIYHYDAPIWGNGNGSRSSELAITYAVRPKSEGECAIGMEHLDTVVAAVCHHNAAVRGDCDIGWVV